MRWTRYFKSKGGRNAFSDGWENESSGRLERTVPGRFQILSSEAGPECRVAGVHRSRSRTGIVRRFFHSDLLSDRGGDSAGVSAAGGQGAGGGVHVCEQPLFDYRAVSAAVLSGQLPDFPAVPLRGTGSAAAPGDRGTQLECVPGAGKRCGALLLCRRTAARRRCGGGRILDHGAPGAPLPGEAGGATGSGPEGRGKVEKHGKRRYIIRSG